MFKLIKNLKIFEVWNRQSNI